MFKSKLSLIIIIFLLGLLFVIFNKPCSCLEFFGNINNQCPNILIQKENSIFLYNSKLAEIPGVNPVKFNNLEDYVEFTNWQRSKGINCPVLFLQHSYDAQGNPIYKQRPSPTDLQGGLPPNRPLYHKIAPVSKLLDANHDDPPYNKNSLPGFDPNDQYIGLNTPLDKMFIKTSNGISANPMDPNWGGGKYTQSLIDKGFYKDNEVSIST